MPAVPCPACGADTPVEAGSAPCPDCGFLVSARPRVRAEVATAERAGGGFAVFAVGGAVVLVAVAGLVGVMYHRKVEAERMERRARLEAEIAAERAVLGREAARREWAADVAALPDRFPPGVLPGMPLPADAVGKREAELREKLMGTWRGPAAGGGVRTVEYRPGGTFRDAVTGAGAREWAGTWAIDRATGARVLRLTRTGGGPDVVTVSVEGDELVHDDAPGRAVVLKRQ